jgi:hypothetical protein
VFREKHSSLLRKPKITAVISFMIQAPGVIFTGKRTLRAQTKITLGVVYIIN